MCTPYLSIWILRFGEENRTERGGQKERTVAQRERAVKKRGSKKGCAKKKERENITFFFVFSYIVKKYVYPLRREIVSVYYLLFIYSQFVLFRVRLWGILYQ